MSEVKVLSVTDEAVAKVIEIRDAEPGDGEYALLLEVTGNQGNQFKYELSFVPLEDREESDVVERFGDLAVVVPSKDSVKLQGATLTIGGDPDQPGLTIDNPNVPASPKMGVPPVGDLSGPLAEQVAQVLESHVNPAIAAHGGQARLVSEEKGTVYVELMGGCQGCGLAAVTLHEGIERIVKEAIPEVVEVVDVTDHASGSDPYYESSKK